MQGRPGPPRGDAPPRERGAAPRPATAARPEVLVPTGWVLPCCSYRGIVVNTPGMRLYCFQPSPGDPRTTRVYPYPVGLGRDDRRTPRGTFRVRAKTVNPRWDIPESIR